MNGIIKPNTGLLFMKVGLHAGETFESILERKQKEYKKSGMIFWGYGGGTCHPTRAVQPFAKMTLEQGEDIVLVMEEINSHHNPTKIIARQFSEDGQLWKPIPRGIQVLSSKYALVLDELREGDLKVDLSEYKVAVGPSKDKQATDYIRGRVDKACITMTNPEHSGLVPTIKNIKHFATLKQPFAVFVR